MPDKDYPQTEQQTSQQEPSQPAAAVWPTQDTSQLLATLNQVFATFQRQLQDRATEPFPDTAKAALAKFDAIVAALQFEL
jgi:hypothetical protein